MTGSTYIDAEHVVQDATLASRIIASIIVPAYNEEEGLSVLLEKIHRSANGVCEVLVVDDGSDDATSEVASGFPCKIVKHRKNRGKGEALKTGVKYASGKYVIFIDADDTYPADVIPQMYEALEFCDVVYGSRRAGRSNIPPFNRLGNFIFQNLIRHLYGFQASDYSTGLYGIRKHYLEAMDICSSGFSIEPEIAIKASRMKLRVKEIPIEYGKRVGQTKLSGPQAGLDHMKTILRLFFWRPSPTKQ